MDMKQLIIEIILENPEFIYPYILALLILIGLKMLISSFKMPYNHYKILKELEEERIKVLTNPYLSDEEKIEWLKKYYP